MAIFLDKAFVSPVVPKKKIPTRRSHAKDNSQQDYHRERTYESDGLTYSSNKRAKPEGSSVLRHNLSMVKHIERIRSARAAESFSNSSMLDCKRCESISKTAGYNRPTRTRRGIPKEVESTPRRMFPMKKRCNLLDVK